MKNKKAQDKLIGIIIIFILIVLLFICIVFIINDFPQFKTLGIGMKPTNRVGILTGLYVQLWGLVFLLSYFYEKNNFVFRGLIWICENWGSPKNRKVAIFTGILGLITGTIMLISGLLGFYV
ncbi:hypothetical protein KAU15_07235 [candidate division WOR-3 bacterium]|nr:hypothetical protein [candidate division WOR-3 bacterium]